MTPRDIEGIAPLLIVSSVPAALAFYRDRLGFTVTFQGPEPDDIFFGMVQRGAAMLMLKSVGVVPLPNSTRNVGKGVARRQRNRRQRRVTGRRSAFATTLIVLTATAVITAGLLLFGTSNAAPTYGPETRPGDNLFSASIVAVPVAPRESLSPRRQPP